jgi:hypothetical protein
MALDADIAEDKDFLTFKERLRFGITALVEEDSNREFPPEEQIEFFEAILERRGPIETGLSMGWSPAQIKRFTENPERAVIMEMLQEVEYETAERAIFNNMLAGNATATKLYAFCKMAHRGWVDRKIVDFHGQSRHEIVVSVREAIDGRITQAVELQGAEGIRALQAGFLTADVPVTEDDEGILEAILVEDD